MNKKVTGAYTLHVTIGWQHITHKLSRVRGRYFVYVLEKDERPIYIGMTSNLMTRLYYHKYRKQFDAIRVLEYEEYNICYEAEKRLIRHYKPRMNIYRYAKHI